MKKTLILGATDNPERYAYLAANRLTAAGHEIVPVGIRNGVVAGVPIATDKPIPADIDTVTLYVGPQRQEEWFDYVWAVNPKRIIFNPGTENEAFEAEAKKRGIKTEEACTLVLLASGQY